MGLTHPVASICLSHCAKSEYCWYKYLSRFVDYI